MLGERLYRDIVNIHTKNLSGRLVVRKMKFLQPLVALCTT